MGYKKAQTINNHRLNVFEESSESPTTKSVQMNTLAQYMAKSFQEAAEKARISFHFGERFHSNSDILWKNRFN